MYSTGDLGGALPGAAGAAAMKAVIDGGEAPDLILFPQNYEGRDVMARLSVKLDRTVLTNNTDIAVDGDTVKVTTPVFGGNTLVTTSFTGSGPYLAAFRPKSFPAEPGGAAAGQRDRGPGARSRVDRWRQGRRRAHRGVDGSEARRGRHRGVGRPWPR